MKNIKNIILTIFAVTSLSACTKEVLQTQGQSIGEKYIGASSGSFSALVTTTGVWSASSPYKWLHVSTDLHKGEYAILVDYDSNESTEAIHRFNRKGYVVISTYDKATSDTIFVYQAGLEPLIDLPAEFNASGKDICFVDFNTNLMDAQRPYVKCSADSPYLKEIKWSDDGEHIQFLRDASASGEALLKVEFTDAWGVVTSGTTKIKM